MNKKSFMRLYLWISIALVLVLAILQFGFTKDLIGEYQLISGNIQSSIFQYNFENFETEINVFNTPLVMYVLFLALTLFVAVLALREPAVEVKLFRDVVVYNVILAILLIVSNIVLMILLPDTVSGVIDYGFFMMKIPMFGGAIVKVYNFTYLFILIYIILNITVLQLTKEKKFKPSYEEVETDSEFLR